MAVNTFYDEFGSVQIYSVLWEKLDGAEADSGFTCLNHFAFR